MNTLLLLLITVQLQGASEFPHDIFTVSAYPPTVMPGDSFYIKIVARNPYAESIYIQEHFLLFEDDIQTHLRDSENQTQPLLFEGPYIDAERSFDFAEIKPGDSRVITVEAINVPPLEDLKEPFWERHLKNLSTSDAKFMLCIAIQSIVASGEKETDKKREVLIFETPLIMKSRPEKEMTLIWEWYDGTPKKLFPFPYGDRNPVRKIAPLDSNSPAPAVFENILVKGKKVSQSQFMRSDNRYPGHPNAPETWQGWKELEESLTPSTMRDEIRLARILIQYSDTEDDTLIKELKDWFADMNEVQRSVLVKRTRNKIKIYEAVKEFDTALLE